MLSLSRAMASCSFGSLVSCVADSHVCLPAHLPAAGRCCYGHSHAAIVNGKSCEWLEAWARPGWDVLQRPACTLARDCTMHRCRISWSSQTYPPLALSDSAATLCSLHRRRRVRGCEARQEGVSTHAGLYRRSPASWCCTSGSPASLLSLNCAIQPAPPAAAPTRSTGTTTLRRRAGAAARCTVRALSMHLLLLLLLLLLLN